MYKDKFYISTIFRSSELTNFRCTMITNEKKKTNNYLRRLAKKQRIPYHIPEIHIQQANNFMEQHITSKFTVGSLREYLKKHEKSKSYLIQEPYKINFFRNTEDSGKNWFYLIKEILGDSDKRAHKLSK